MQERKLRLCNSIIHSPKTFSYTWQFSLTTSATHAAGRKSHGTRVGHEYLTDDCKLHALLDEHFQLKAIYARWRKLRYDLCLCKSGVLRDSFWVWVASCPTDQGTPIGDVFLDVLGRFGQQSQRSKGLVVAVIEQRKDQDLFCKVVG